MTKHLSRRLLVDFFGQAQFDPYLLSFLNQGHKNDRMRLRRILDGELASS